MSAFTVNEHCNGCLACEANCPAEALRHRDENGLRTLSHNLSRCARCGHCARICPTDAIEFDQLLNGKWEPVVRLGLVYCVVCGKPLYSEKLRGTLEETAGVLSEPLCEDHKARGQAKTWQKTSGWRTGS